MSLSIGTQSTQNPSIFSQSESYLSTNTQWTSEASIKLGYGKDRVDGDAQQSLMIGRPPNKWTCTRLRKLARLYLLTDLELDGIIGLLRTEDFQPCKRNVQEKLNMLLQPHPNKIRLKGDTKVLRRLLLECRRLQIRRRRKQHRCRLEQRRGPLDGDGLVTMPLENSEGIVFSTANSTMHADLSCASNDPPDTFDSFDYEESFVSTEPFGLEASAPSLTGEQNEGCYAPTPAVGTEWPNNQLITVSSDLPTTFVDWHLLDFGVQPERPGNAPMENNFIHSNYYPPRISNFCDLMGDIENPYSDLGFDTDFGPKSDHPILESGFIPYMSKSMDNLAAAAEPGTNLSCPNVPQPSKPFTPSADSHSVPGGWPIVNPTHVRDSFGIANNLLSGTYSCYDFELVNGPALAMSASHLSILEHPTQSGDSSLRGSLLNAQDAMSFVECLSTSKPSSSGSEISTILSKMSLSPLSPTSANGFAVESDSLVILPGVFPEYCWQHINQNRLLRCNHADGTKKCVFKRHLQSAPTHRSLRADILSRVVQRTIRAADLCEIDAFGNSIIHISATMLAPPSYLSSLVKLGAKVNSLNNAGQTFLHLVKPEVLNQCDDFCDLLELLSIQGFNFCQHDHLGQSPLHLLTRPWIHADILRKVITKLDSLLIHSHFSTARDCLGYTVVGQMNILGTQSSRIDLDQAILSLACETDKHIINPKDLQMPKRKWSRKKSSGKDEQLTRNYENHPSINTVDDLLRYEQHVDYWRTIITAKDSPWFEDSNGRNGLHCLAEATPVSSDMPLPDLLWSQLHCLKEIGYAENNSDRECFIKSLLNAGVDPNNYDNEGNTPLMTFIIHLRAGESDDCITRILSYLFEAGSDIHRRNRRGETALHLAVKLGCRAATEVLLASGANIHARTSSGLGVLELGQKHSMESEQDENLYAQILLCTSLSASFGAVSEPTILDEWASPQWRLASHSRSEPKRFKLVKKFIASKVHGRCRGKHKGVKQVLGSHG